MNEHERKKANRFWMWYIVIGIAIILIGNMLGWYEPHQSGVDAWSWR